MYTKDNASAAPGLESLPLKESVSQYGITWTFEKPARVGRFVNGDWYVVGPVTIQMIAPKPLFGDEVKETMDKEEIHESRYPGKQARHGSSLNPPSKAKTAGFDSRIPGGRYDPNLFSHLPIAMKPGDSLVSTISRENSEITMFEPFTPHYPNKLVVRPPVSAMREESSLEERNGFGCNTVDLAGVRGGPASAAPTAANTPAQTNAGAKPARLASR